MTFQSLFKYIISINSIFVSKSILCQNLVPNSSFEDINICEEYHQPCSPSAWFYIQNLTVGYASFDNIKSPTGNKHLNILVARRDSAMRQYWETMLLCKLQSGKKYIIKAKISAQNSGPNLNDLGFYFTNEFVFSNRDTILKPDGFFSFLNCKSRAIKNGWYAVEKEITINKDAQYLIIGNFAKQADNEIFANRKNFFQYINLLVDDIVVEPLSKQTCPDYEKRRDSLYAIYARHSSFVRMTANSEIMDTGLKKEKGQKEIDTVIIKDVLFESNSYILKDEEILDKYKYLFEQRGILEIKIIGFTDSTGTEISNIKLSEKRARTIANLIKSKFNIPEFIKVEWKGEGISKIFPIKEENRRVEVHILRQTDIQAH